MDRLRYVVAYDIADDKRRNRVAKCLNDYGRRVQFSVFEMALSRSLFDNMIRELQERYDPKQDRIAVYPLCSSCTAKAEFLGRGSEDERPGDEVVFVV